MQIETSFFTDRNGMPCLEGKTINIIYETHNNIGHKIVKTDTPKTKKAIMAYGQNLFITYSSIYAFIILIPYLGILV